MNKLELPEHCIIEIGDIPIAILSVDFDEWEFGKLDVTWNYAGPQRPENTSEFEEHIQEAIKAILLNYDKLIDNGTDNI